MSAAARPVARVRVVAGRAREGTREAAVEAAVALVFDGTTEAVLMASPTGIEDLALGFALTEGIVERAEELRGIETVERAQGIEARVWLARPRAARLAERRRTMLGPTGCGLCGVESLAAALALPPAVASDLRLAPEDVADALAALSAHQPLGRLTRATHAAALWRPAAGLVAVREDVGRHNALDKLAGGLARAGETGAGGVVVLTSRVTVELVQKTARLGAPMLVAVSAPSALAVETAEAAGITLIAVAREDGFEVFSRVERVVLEGEVEGPLSGAVRA
ncbi:MAG: formate dehydrogenase accessory sulfurtransferase FdhD [Paracoccaceae bacterium]